jgi:hypothetical protein
MVYVAMRYEDGVRGATQERERRQRIAAIFLGVGSTIQQNLLAIHANLEAIRANFASSA